MKTLEILSALRSDPAPPAASWERFTPADWPALFHLLDLAADLPRLAGNRALGAWPRELWPELADVTGDLLRLQGLVDRPVVPPAARLVRGHGPGDVDAAAAELEESHCAHVDGLLDADARRRLDAEVECLAALKLGSWGELERGESPELYGLFEGLLGGDAFRRLTGFDLDRDEYTLTLSLQDLEPTGIGWHRDLYWPKEWVGEDVFAVLYALGTDTPEKGGAFVYYVPWANEVRAFYREKHQATILWNSADQDGRLIHAVSGFNGEATDRHLVILQCHRRAPKDG